MHNFIYIYTLPFRYIKKERRSGILVSFLLTGDIGEFPSAVGFGLSLHRRFRINEEHNEQLFIIKCTIKNLQKLLTDWASFVKL